MALLTIPSITKGVAASVSLNKTDLFALAAVAADAYFSDESNVKRCVVEFNSTIGNQRRVLSFDLSVASPTATFLISERARNDFLLERLVLEDFDGDVLVLERSQLPSGLDIAIGPSTINGTATSLSWRDDLDSNLLAAPFTPAGVTYSSNTYSYSVAGGVMTLSVNMVGSGSSGVAHGAGIIEVVLPSGYTHAAANFTSVGSVEYRDRLDANPKTGTIKTWTRAGTPVLRFIDSGGNWVRGAQSLNGAWFEKGDGAFGNPTVENRWIFTATVAVTAV